MSEKIPLSDWTHATAEVPDRGLARERAASEAECGEIARALKLISLDKLVAAYRITSIAGGGWRLTGKIAADLVQSCIVSLEPVPAHMEETFDVEFLHDTPASESGGDLSVLEGPDIEPLNGNEIAAGRVVFETLAAGLDPYPRKGDASFKWQDNAASGDNKISPFAVLARLKDKE
jgi:uncharacterized metal-binding protein YceD (DUF177 family)